MMNTWKLLPYYFSFYFIFGIFYDKLLEKNSLGCEFTEKQKRSFFTHLYQDTIDIQHYMFKLYNVLI